MKLEGAKQREEKKMDLKGIEITVKPVGLRTWLLINQKVLDPKPPSTLSTRGELIVNRTPEHVAACEEMDMARLMVMFYFCVRHNATLQFEIPQREIDTIDSSWAIALLKEVANFLDMSDLAQIKDLVMEATGVGDSEVTRAREDFLAQRA